MPATPKHPKVSEERVATRRLEDFDTHQLYPTADLEGIDPVTRPEPGLIGPTTHVGSIGSCFSAEIRRWLLEHKFNYLQTATGPTSGYGSGRFGIVLTPPNLSQTFRTAFGEFRRAEPTWAWGDRLIDPYRKNIVWRDRAAADQELAEHYESVRALARSAEVLICTLGATEYWRDRATGAAFATVPPQAALDPARHEFVTASVETCEAEIESMWDLLHRTNPRLRLILSLSPVPLRATYSSRHCVVADTLSKATLRVAIDRFCARWPSVIYMPSYEIVTRLTLQPYESDNHHVRREAVARVMSLFMRNFGPAAATDAQATRQPAATCAAQAA